MGYAIVNTGAAPLYDRWGEGAVLADEALHGMVVEVLERPAPGWCRVRTHYRCEGYTRLSGLVDDDAAAGQWRALGKMVARAPFVDVMAGPRADSALVETLPRGGLVHIEADAGDIIAAGGPAGGPLSEGWPGPEGKNQPEPGASRSSEVAAAGDIEPGWLPVRLADGRRGFARQGNLMPHLTQPGLDKELQLREALATTALSYLGTQYRWGGKTPQGIDCSGLVSMAYLLNGFMINRNAAMGEGFALKPVAREALKLGDVIYFSGHAALYLGDEQYLHATGQAGSDAVVINSLAPTSPFYRQDLAESISACGSLFG